jgi:type IV pilus assembly protein PilW
VELSAVKRVPAPLAASGREAGFTLVEIMVALLVSLFLLAGVLQIYLGTKSSYRFQEGMSRLQENGRFAQYYLDRALRLAGYKSDSRTDDGQAFPADTTTASYLGGVTFTASQIVGGVDDNSIGDPFKGGSDVLVLRYRGSETPWTDASENNPDGLITDCLGTAVDAEEFATMAFFVDTNDHLACRSKTDDENQNELAEGIEDMRVLYGVDLNGDRSADKYVAASQVAAAEWQTVVSVRVALLVSTGSAVTSEPDTVTYSLLGVDKGPFNDRRRRQVFTTTINLRNRTP